MFRKNCESICALFVAMIGLSTSAIGQPAVPALGVAERPHILVRGEAEILVEPDYALLRLAVEHFGSTVAEVRTDNQNAVERLLAEARKGGVADADLATTPSMVFPDRWQCSNCSDAEKKSGQTAHTDVTITLRKIAQVSDLVFRISSDSHVLLRDVEYRTSALREHRDQARVLAIRAAREKAVALTKEIGQTIGRALSIDEQASGGGGYWSWSQWGYNCCGYYSSYGVSGNQAMTQNVSVAAPSNGDSAVSGALAPGRIQVRAQVSVSFELL